MIYIFQRKSVFGFRVRWWSAGWCHSSELAFLGGRIDGGGCFRHYSLCVDPDPSAAPVTDHDPGFACIEVHGALIEGQVHMRFVSFDGGQAREEPEPREGRSEEHTSELQSLMRISYAVFCSKKIIATPPTHKDLYNSNRLTF